jgi:hypothetical protein
VTRHLLLGFLIVVTPLLAQQAASPDDARSSAVHPSGIAQSTQKPQHPRKDVATIAKESNGAVVSIVMADKSGQPIAQGSGFVVARNGLVVTNCHVIKSGASAVIKLPDGSFFTVDGLLAFDEYNDIAVIKAHGNNFKTVALGDSDRLQIGDEVVAIGSPLSLESTVSNGIVSGIRDEKKDVFDEMAGHGQKILQITAPISHGSSGGPLFNMAGEVVGITSATLVDGENLNFAVAINDAKKLLRTLDEHNVANLPDYPEEAAATPKASAPTDDAPSLEETEQWMTKFTIAYARRKQSKTVLQFGSRGEAFDQCDLFQHEFIGEDLDHEGPFERSTEINGELYSLADVDPTQISVHLNMMLFANTNAKLSIMHGRGIFYTADWNLFFDSEAHANQFAKAFKHAVSLCSGKASAY